MRNPRWLAVLMGVTIFAIIGFQLYWLKKNYEREERTLEIKTNMAFRRTIQKLQATKLNLDFNDSARPKMRVMLDAPRYRGDSERIVNMLTVLKERAEDSLHIAIRDSGKDKLVTKEIKQPATIILDEQLHDSSMRQPWRTNRFVQYLYGIDSLQDSIRIKEIIPEYRKALEKENAVVPFSIVRLGEASQSKDPVYDEITIGFTKPITYKLQLGNTFPYLFKRLTMPLLFSIFLIGVTVLSFVLLYRNLLKQRKLAEIKNEFISNITHELKTPIATVGVAIEALKNFNAMADPQRTREYLDISSNELLRLSLLVDKVLKLSMFENKEIELRYEPVDVKSIVDEVLSSMKLQLEKSNASVSLHSSGDVGIRGDKLHLLSVVYNLVDNALKYSSNNPEIKIDLAQQNGHVVMKFADNGIGIAPEYQEKIFEKFFRVPAGNTHNAKGYGLGLSYTAHVVRKHDGNIMVESKPGSGSTFTVVLPKQPS